MALCRSVAMGGSRALKLSVRVVGDLPEEVLTFSKCLSVTTLNVALEKKTSDVSSDVVSLRGCR